MNAQDFVTDIAPWLAIVSAGIGAAGGVVKSKSSNSLRSSIEADIALHREMPDGPGKDALKKALDAQATRLQARVEHGQILNGGQVALAAAAGCIAYGAAWSIADYAMRHGWLPGQSEDGLATVTRWISINIPVGVGAALLGVGFAAVFLRWVFAKLELAVPDWQASVESFLRPIFTGLLWPFIRALRLRRGDTSPTRTGDTAAQSDPPGSATDTSTAAPDQQP